MYKREFSTLKDTGETLPFSQKNFNSRTVNFIKVCFYYIILLDLKRIGMTFVWSKENWNNVFLESFKGFYKYQKILNKTNID